MTPKLLTRENLDAITTDPAMRRLIVEGDMNEHLYLKMEGHLPCPPMSDEMLARMNKAMNFEHAPKDRDYRPYCLAEGCKRMPRMMRVKEGFKCWSCFSVWDLRSDEEKAQDSNG